MRVPTSLLAIWIALMSSPCILAQNYYVANGGDDTNTGLTPGDPFETIQHAADLASAGDTIFVSDGAYEGFDIRDVNGTASDPIVFKAIGDSALIDQSGPIRNDGINVENADHVVIDGFIVNGMPGNGNGVRVVLSDHCVVRNCRCDSNAERGIFTGFTDDIIIENNICTNSLDEHGIYVSNSSDRPIVRYNTCYGNNNIGIHMNGDLSAGGDGIISDAQVYGNIIFENGLAAGINMDGLMNPEVYNNLIYNNHFAQGIALFQQDGAIPTQGAKIYNNTIIVPPDGRWGILINEGCNINTEVFNNIILNFHAWRGCITIEDTTGFQSDFNILHDKMSDSGDGSSITLSEWQALGLDTHSQLAEALGDIFTDPDASNYSIEASSQAVDTGTDVTLSNVDIDISGVARPYGGAVDIGAYEYTPYCGTCWTGGPVVYVDSAATGNFSGVSWSDAFNDLQDALFAVRYYPQAQQIWVAKGTYYPDSGNDRSRYIELTDSVRVYGGFQGVELSADLRNPEVNQVRLSGDIGIAGVSDDNSWHVVRVDVSCAGCVLDGVVIQDGNALDNDGLGSALKCFGMVSLVDTRIEDCLPISKQVFIGQGANVKLAGGVISIQD